MKKIVAVILVIMSLFSTVAMAEGKLEAIQAAGKMVICTDAAWSPF